MSPISERAGRQNLSRTVVVAAAAFVGVATAAALGLWVHYGTAVFVETIVAGIQACL
ncbi:hypothetical protein RA307_24485 [Xanthobacteraceae bacterium Astr-EGSB]|uniref:hypothetical protein n=1 Tax=Astrobacterium formosum TaxID=3069710 RepID=UPI0027B87B12|nr:hypothetical protein [Xanthobacteraceae bacterium Astr-EGSB]